MRVLRRPLRGITTRIRTVDRPRGSNAALPTRSVAPSTSAGLDPPIGGISRRARVPLVRSTAGVVSVMHARSHRLPLPGCASPCVPAFRAGPLLLGDAAAAEVLPRLDIRRNGQTIDSSQRATGVALRALRMAREPEVEEVVAHVVATPRAHDRRPIGGLAAARWRVHGVDVDAVAGSEPAKADVLIAAGADSP